MTSWLFLIAYTCSGLAGLIYEVTWTRLLTLYIGHTTAAASAVVAAFLGGLAIGAAVGGRVASALSPRRSLQAYVGLEIAVAIVRAAAAVRAVVRWRRCCAGRTRTAPAARCFPWSASSAAS